MTEKDKQQDNMQALSNQLASAESSLREVHRLIQEMGVKPEDLPEPSQDKPTRSQQPAPAVSGKVIEGKFDGQHMVADGGKTYPVPANYASKSKLIEGQPLKLTIAEDGSFVYKQISPIERKKLIGKLVLEDGQYKVEAAGKSYKVLFASVTYFKGNPGDEVTIEIPASGDAHWAAVEAIIGD